MGTRLEPFIECWVGLARPPAGRVIMRSGWSPDPLDAYCARCGESVGPGEETDSGCGSCRGRRVGVDRTVRLGAYVDPLRGWIANIKYDRWDQLGVVLGSALGRAVADRCAVKRTRTLCIPVPMPWQRRLYRGIDHASVIAHAAARAMNVREVSLLAKPNGPAQTSLTATKRARRGKGWIRPARRMRPGVLQGVTVILIDDVRTTGATLNAAARIVRSFGAARVIGGVLAVADSVERRTENLATVVDGYDARPSVCAPS